MRRVRQKLAKPRAKKQRQSQGGLQQCPRHPAPFSKAMRCRDTHLILRIQQRQRHHASRIPQIRERLGKNQEADHRKSERLHLLERNSCHHVIHPGNEVAAEPTCPHQQPQSEQQRTEHRQTHQQEREHFPGHRAPGSRDGQQDGLTQKREGLQEAIQAQQSEQKSGQLLGGHGLNCWMA